MMQMFKSVVSSASLGQLNITLQKPYYVSGEIVVGRVDFAVSAPLQANRLVRAASEWAALLVRRRALARLITVRQVQRHAGQGRFAWPLRCVSLRARLSRARGCAADFSLPPRALANARARARARHLLVGVVHRVFYARFLRSDSARARALAHATSLDDSVMIDVCPTANRSAASAENKNKKNNQRRRSRSHRCTSVSGRVSWQSSRKSDRARRLQ